jgi:hypothetical protein
VERQTPTTAKSRAKAWLFSFPDLDPLRCRLQWEKRGRAFLLVSAAGNAPSFPFSVREPDYTLGHARKPKVKIQDFILYGPRGTSLPATTVLGGRERRGSGPDCRAQRGAAPATAYFLSTPGFLSQPDSPPPAAFAKADRRNGFTTAGRSQLRYLGCHRPPRGLTMFLTFSLTSG